MASKNSVSTLKLAFVGTSCVGKTTLLDLFRDKYAHDDRVAIIEEVAREFFEQNAVNNRFSAQTQGQLQNLILQREKVKYVDGVKAMLCDRSVIDAVVYTEGHGDPEGAAVLLDNVRDWLPTYHTFFLLDPKDIAYQTDKVRTENAAKRQQFHEAFLRFFEVSRIPYQLLSGTIEQRFNKVRSLLAFNGV